ncbi:TetR/AcrR family transcriptional regulator [Streptomyces sp. Z26]|uniref:TetR/AcrR family transcriptional regulator n=1 Tax=Streptomyces TaxID=1883 RepID=UPI000EF1360A|nr:TetR/AcrR family transcriptional regulator [Streptomyces sp. Z26]RLL67235.1 TetR/AcrR family transcriptional regulator [Streptomyces sp. Z26]
MSRWQPDASGRLVKAALELYAERGYEQTTVAEIAARAGLTERTFFRHHADKREVLFGGSREMAEAFAAAVAEAPGSAAPIDAVAVGLDAIAEGFTGRLEFVRRRQAVIAASAELRERELVKLASLADALTVALRGRGVAEPAASLTAEAGIAAFKVGFARWVADPDDGELAHWTRDSLRALRAATGEG